MAGPLLAGDNPMKIKGGKWTVARFFIVSTAYTSVWLAVSSQLGNYRHLFGPQVLLQLNIAYFLPSIPLLIVSGLSDKWLERKLGVAGTVLVRLWVGLLGYGAICAWFPFQPLKIWYLLGSVVALGLFSGIAFSASYQLVARFANKNVIALGLGFSASGPLVLLLQIAFGVGTSPTKREEIMLYETITVIVVAGLWATTSLLVRHWDAIEGFEQKHTQQLTVPPQQQGQQAQQGAGGELSEPFLRVAAVDGLEGGEAQLVLPSPHGPGTGLPSSPIYPTGLPPLIAYNSLEPYQTFVTADEEGEGDPVGEGPLPNLQSSSWTGASVAGSSEDGTFVASSAPGRLERRYSDPSSEVGTPRALAPLQGGGQGKAPGGLPPLPPPGWSAAERQGSGEAAMRLPQQVVATLRGRVSFNSVASNLETGSPHYKPGSPDKRAGQQEDMRQLARAALCKIWPALCALGLSCTISLVIFPFFTYVPTSGLLGDALPKTLFFVRIFADIFGRFLPRLRLLALENPGTVLLVAFGKLACVPAFFLYLKSPDRLHSDVAAVAFIVLLWTIGGYVNTMANLLAPRLVPPHLKATAAGLMAITYQTAHLVGLVIATVAALLLFGDIGVE